jgi:hypothetical protein
MDEDYVEGYLDDWSIVYVFWCCCEVPFCWLVGTFVECEGDFIGCRI